MGNLKGENTMNEYKPIATIYNDIDRVEITIFSDGTKAYGEQGINAEIVKEYLDEDFSAIGIDEGLRQMYGSTWNLNFL